jgi:putative hydrolase of the HAD superfamily
MDYKTVTLDFWDTLAFYPMTDEIFMERVAHASDIFRKYDIGYETSIMLMRSIYENFENLWHNEFRTPTTPESFRFIEKIIGYEFDKKHFDELVRYNEQLITEKYFVLRREVGEAIIKLAEKYRLVIISDTGFEPGRELRKALEKHGLMKYITEGVFSDETGFSKPDIRAFQKASEISRTALSEMIHVGDRELKDIRGASDAGMGTILFTGFRPDDKDSTTADHTADSWNEVLRILL